MRYLNLKSLYCDVNLLNPNYFIVTVTYGIIFGGGGVFTHRYTAVNTVIVLAL